MNCVSGQHLNLIHQNQGSQTYSDGCFYPLIRNNGKDKYLVLGVYFADEEIEDVEVATVEKHIDEAQHGGGARGCSCPTHQPHDGFNHSNRQQVQTRQRGDHRVPLRKVAIPLFTNTD